MSRFKGFMHSLRALLRPDAVNDEAADEAAFHIERQTQKHIANGHSATDAHAMAMAEFGGVTRWRQAAADTRRGRWIESAWQDVRHSVRALRKHRGFSAVAVLTLAVGIGATTIAYTTIDHVLWRPLPYENVDRLVLLKEANTANNTDFPFSIPNLNDVARLTHSFSVVAAAQPTTNIFDTGGDSDGIEVTGAAVTPNFFGVFGMSPQLGRFIAADDVAASAPLVTVLSYAMWKNRLGSDPKIIGKSVRLGGVSRIVIGVTPATLVYPADAQFWTPCRYCANPPEMMRASIGMIAVARLAPGSTVASATVDLNHAASLIQREHPKLSENQMTAGRVTLLTESVVSESRATLRFMTGAILCVLLIGCANLANANLARNTVRQNELSLRAALGASRGRVMQLLFIESLVLSVAGCAIGLLGAMWGTRMVARYAGEFVPRLGELQLDARAIGFALVVAGIVAVTIGLLPALRLSAAELRHRMGERGHVSRGHALSRRFLVGAQTALAVVLLTGAGLSIRSLQLVLREPPGVNPNGVVTFRPITSGRLSTGNGAVLFYDDLLTRIRALPGVTGATAASAPPLGMQWTGFIEVEGQEGLNRNGDVSASAGYNLVTEGFFETVGLPLQKGRLFTAADDSLHPHVTVINQTMAKMYWPNADPIGRRFKALSMDTKKDVWLTVIGVVGDIRMYSLENDPVPTHYVSSRQRPDRLQSSTVIVRTTQATGSAVRALRQVLYAVDPTATARITTLNDRVDETTSSRRLMVKLLASFAGAALLLAAIGIYGVLSYTVAQRTREIGVRMALGSSAMAVVRLMVGDIMTPVAVGLVIGLIAARMLSKVLKSLVYQVSPTDPFVLGVACLALITLALIAAVVPARRVASVDPLLALRGD